MLACLREGDLTGWFDRDGVLGRAKTIKGRVLMGDDLLRVEHDAVNGGWASPTSVTS